MKKFALGLSLVLSLLFLVQGCKRNPHVAKNVKTEASSKEETLKPAFDQLHRATEAAQYRDALQLFNAQLSQGSDQKITPPSTDDKESLRKLYGLDAEEWAEVDAGLFRPLDAFHLQNSFLFRDAGRLLDIPKATPLEQVQLCFAWAMRRVQLHEQANEGLPAAFVLRRGFGSGLDRALVFLAVLRQFQFEGCLLTIPDDSTQVVLVGVLIPAKDGADAAKSLVLFDPRLGQPVAGPDGKGTATLGEARARPELLKASGLSADQVTKLEVYQAIPIEALSARMRYLQGLLAFQDKVILYQDALALDRELTKVAGRPALVWNSPPLPKSPATTRALRQFLSKDDGGIDTSGRHLRFQRQQIPGAVLGLHLQEMRLDIPEQALVQLSSFTVQLFNLVAVQPREFFLHGQFDAAFKRLDRIRNVLETEEAANPLEKAEFQRQIAEWRERVRQAYISLLVHKEQNGQAKVSALWNEDQYLLNVLQVDSEIPLESYSKKTLSLIILNTCREPLGRQVSYLAASCLHEKAAQLQANLDFLTSTGKDVAIVKENADFAWRNARRAWGSYLDHYALFAPIVPMRLKEIAQRWNPANVENAVSLWEQLFLDMHATFEARLRLAETQVYLKSSDSGLKELLEDLDAFQNSDLPKTLAKYVEAAKAPGQVAKSLELLNRDWQPQGNIHWLRESVRLKAAQAK
jgi:hypothetical protein